MIYWKMVTLGGVIAIGLISSAFAEDYSLYYFLNRTVSKSEPLSSKEKVELLKRIERLLQQAQEIHQQMVRDLKIGEIEIRYQEGEFWLSKLKEDEKSIEAGIGQIKLLKEKPNHLSSSVGLYKSLRDLSINFNIYNNIPSFSAFVGDLAPELGLWADPVFFQLYLLPLARWRDIEKVGPQIPQKEKGPVTKGKRP